MDIHLFTKVLKEELSSYRDIIATRLSCERWHADVDDVYQLAIIAAWQYLKDEQWPEEEDKRILLISSTLQRSVSWELSVFIRAKNKWPEVDGLDAVMEATDECCNEVSETLPGPMRRVLEAFILNGCDTDLAASRVSMDPKTFKRRLRLIRTFLRMKGHDR